MQFFFIQDYRRTYRFFSSEPVQNIQVKFTRLEELWIKAKKKLMLLPKRILAQEQAFSRVRKLEEETIQIYHSGRLEEKKIRRRFFLFIQKQRTKHTLFVIGESILLPITGVMALLPGPNIFFGVLALVMITHWQALRGINSLSRKKHIFITASSFQEWELSVDSKQDTDFLPILTKIEKEYSQEDLHKILFK
ncbi:hypothetical protein ACFLT2_04450 [Acidobacteriota bacterium]